MAIVPWVFESGWLESRTLREGYAIKIEITHQNTTAATWASGLSVPDFATDVVTGDFSIWSLSKIPRVSSADVGAIGAATLNLGARNSFINTDGVDVASGDLFVGGMYKVLGYDSVTHDGTTYTTGEYFRATATTYTTVGTGTVERYHTLWSILYVQKEYVDIYTLHVRISTKAYGGSYVIRFQGTIDPASLELEVSNTDDPEEWNVKFKAMDSLNQLTKKTANEMMEAQLTHAVYDYDVSSAVYPTGAVFITNVSDYVESGITHPPGKYLLSQLLLPKLQDSDGDEWINANNLRWIKLVDIFGAISDYLGYAGSVNDGGAWSNFHSWRFYYNTATSAGSGGTSLSYVGIDELYVISQMNVSANINEQLTFFDPNSQTSYSLKTMGSALEILKQICVSFGLVCRTKFNASNERYLEIIEAARLDDTITITDYSDYADGFKFVPNDFGVDGVKIPSYAGGSDVTKGNGESQNSVQFDQLFCVANNQRAQYEFKYSEGRGITSGSNRVVSTRPGADFFCSLWTLQGLTGSTADNAYTICAVMPRSNGTASTSAPSNMPEYGQQYGTDGVIYPPTNTPSTDQQYWTFVEVMAWALAHYMFNDVAFSSDPVGLARSQAIKIDITKLSIDHTQVYEPPYKLAATIDAEDYEFIVTDSDEDLENDTVNIKGHTK